MNMRLISIAQLHAKKWTAHIADENDYPLCGVRKKQGIPVIPGTVSLGCSRCMDKWARLKFETTKEKACIASGSSPTMSAST